MSNPEEKEQRRNTHMKGGKQEAYSILEEMLIGQCLETFSDYINDGLNYVKSRRKRKFGLHAYVQKVLRQNDIYREENKIKSHIAKIAKSKFMDTHIIQTCKKYNLNQIIKNKQVLLKKQKLRNQDIKEGKLIPKENNEIAKIDNKDDFGKVSIDPRKTDEKMDQPIEEIPEQETNVMSKMLEGFIFKI